MAKKKFFTIAIFLMVTLFSAALYANSKETAVDAKQSSLSIDEKIETLKEMKLAYEAKATYHENQGQRLQFVQGQLQLAKRHWQLAEANREAAKVVQEKIDKLEREKNKD